MSGHSKWAQIKRKKGATDVKRGKLFSQLTKAITVAARTSQNLDMAIDRAKAVNMPADTINRAINKGIGPLNDGIPIESAVYEVYGPGGSALIISVLTDNKNRTLAEIKTILKRLGGRFADAGSVQYLFDRQGVIEIGGDPTRSVDELQLALIDAGAAEIDRDEEHLMAFTDPSHVATVRTAVGAAGFQVLEAKLMNVAKLPITLSAEDESTLLQLMEAIDELDDVQSVETNADLAAT